MADPDARAGITALRPHGYDAADAGPRNADGLRIDRSQNLGAATVAAGAAAAVFSP
jgi:sugar lactone lactonase YvrE